MKVEFIGPIEVMRGSLSKGSEYYYKVQNGKNIIAHKPRRTAKMEAALQSPAAQARRERFAHINRMAAEVMGTKALREQYMLQYNKQKKYATLRGFIAHCISQTL